MYLLILLLPLLSFLFISLFGRYFGRDGNAFLSTFCLFLCWLISLFIFYEVCLHQAPVTINLYDWILIDIYTVTFGFLFDTLSSFMVIIILSISALVHLYSTAYMSHDPHLSRFMSYLSLSTLFTLFSVTSSNFVQMFIGWEGVGLCSYLLTNFWFTRIAANKAAIKAMIVNRIADVFFIIAILLIYSILKTTDYIIVTTLLSFIRSENIIFVGIELPKISLITFFLLIGAIGKSAQIGLHTWLPDAMEGPTPVSSLLHAATMVTAGVFLIVRCSIFFEHSEKILFLLTFFGGTTAFFFGIVAIFQYDIKKIIAYSTCSQLGYMFFSCGISNYYVAFYHLFNHAFFKALLFLSAGSVIHAMFDEQDIRRMGNLNKVLPFTYVCFLIGSLAIIGSPFSTGFYSKDLILEFAYTRFIVDATFIYSLGLISAIFTAIYSIRSIILVLFSKYSGTFFKYAKYFLNNTAECEWQMHVSMFILSIASIFIGYLFSDILLGAGTFFWNDSIFILPSNFGFIDPEFMHPLVKILPVFCSICAMFICWILLYTIDHYILYRSSTNLSRIFYSVLTKISSFFYHAGFFNTIYNNIFLNIFELSYWSTNKYLDKGIFEYLGPFGIYNFFKNLHFMFKDVWVPLIFMYIFSMLIICFLILFCIAVTLQSIHLLIINYLGILPLFLICLYILWGKERE